MITGAFSLVRQAIQLGLIPRLEVTHTSASQEGQIYIGRINRLLLIGVLLLVIAFKSSSALASAYGIAVTGTMVLSTSLLFIVVWRKWGWPLWAAILFAASFLVVEFAFLAANLMKVKDGGWVPLALGGCVMIVMWTWTRGTRLLAEKTHRDSIPMMELIAMLQKSKPTRVPGTAIFLTSDPAVAPTALMHNLKHNKVLHERVLVICVRTEDRPRVAPDKRFEIEKLSRRFLPRDAALWLHGKSSRSGRARRHAQGRVQIRHHDHELLPGPALDQGKPLLRNARLAGQALCRADPPGRQRDGLLLNPLRPRRGIGRASDDLARAKTVDGRGPRH